MLKLKFHIKKVIRHVVLLIPISFIAFQSVVNANVKELTAEQYRLLGYEEQQKGNLNDALTFYIKAISLGLENASIFNDLGILYEQLGASRKAEEVYHKAIAADNAFLPAYTNLGYLYQKNGNKEKAFEYFKKRYNLSVANDPWRDIVKEEFLKIHPEYAKVMIEREADKLAGDVLLQKQNDFYEQIKKSKEHDKKAHRAFTQKKYQEALAEYDKALVLTPKNPEILRAREQVLMEVAKQDVREHSAQAIQLLESGDAISARNEIQKILTIIPGEPVLTSK